MASWTFLGILGGRMSHNCQDPEPACIVEAQGLGIQGLQSASHCERFENYNGWWCWCNIYSEALRFEKLQRPNFSSFTHLSQAQSKLCLTCASCREFSEDKDVAARTTALFNCDISFPCCVSWERRTKPKKPIYKPPGSENYLPGIRWKYSKCLQRTLGLWVGRTTDLLIYSSLTGIEWLVWNLQRLPRISQSKTAVPLPFP